MQLIVDTDSDSVTDTSSDTDSLTVILIPWGLTESEGWGLNESLDTLKLNYKVKLNTKLYY